MRFLFAFLLLASPALGADPLLKPVPDFPIVCLTHPRNPEGGWFKTQSVAESGGPYVYHTGTDLVVANLKDGTETVLVRGQQDVEDGQLRAVHDFCVSNDCKGIYYSHVRTWTDKSGAYCDLYYLDLVTMETRRLTNSRDEWSPPAGSHDWDHDNTPYFEFGRVFNMSPCDTPIGVVFTSNRHSIQSPGEHYPAQQLFLMDHDGSEVRFIGEMNLGGAAHPTLGPDVRIDWSSGEQQGTRGGHGNNWAIFSSNPDGSAFAPEVSAIQDDHTGRNAPMHFQTVTSDGTRIIVRYYDVRTYGMWICIPLFKPGLADSRTKFGPPLANDVPHIWRARKTDTDRFRQGNVLHLGFQPRGAFNPIPWTTDQDRRNVDSPSGQPLGMVSHPWRTPGNGVLGTHTGFNGDGKMQLSIFWIPDVAAVKFDPRSPKTPELVSTPDELNVIISDPSKHYWMAQPLVSFADVYGHEPPVPQTAVAENEPPASPFVEVVTTSLHWRELTVQPDRRIEFPTEDIEWLRVLTFNPTMAMGNSKVYTRNQSGKNVENREGFSSYINERTGFYETLIPAKKWQLPDGTIWQRDQNNPLAPIPDGAELIVDEFGNPDTSLRFKLVGESPFSFQLLDLLQHILPRGTAETWHHGTCSVDPRGRPERIINCMGGCHAHHNPSPLEWENVFASKPEYPVRRLTKARFVEYHRDIKPIVEKYELTWGPRPWETWPGIMDDRYTPEEARLVRAWAATSYLAATAFADGTPITPEHGVGPFADTVQPTLAWGRDAENLYVGAADVQTGINPESLSVTINGADMTEHMTLIDGDGEHWARWKIPFAGPVELEASIRDRQVARDQDGRIVSELGNLTRLSRRIEPVDEPVPPDDPEPDPDPRDEIIRQLKAELLRLTGEKDSLADDKRRAIETLEALLESLR